MSRTAEEFTRRPSVPDTHFVDNRIYADLDIFREEHEKILSKVWKFVAHESEIAKPNDYRTTTVAGTPLVVARGRDGVIRTFVNACSHRGAQILKRPRGNAKEWECLFHRWVYDGTSGQCIGIPRREAFEAGGLRAEDCGLRQVKTETRLGLVFVNLDDDSGSIDDFLGDALELHAETLGTQELEVFDYFEHVLEANWKNWQETNMDLYHEFMHVVNRRQSMTEKSYYRRKWRIYPNGHVAPERYVVRYARQQGWSEREAELRLPGIEPNEFQIINIFPDLAINARGTVIRIDCQIPLAPGRTLIQYRGLGVKGDSPAERRQRAKDFNAFWGPFGRNLPEDLLASVLQNRAMQGGQVPYTYWARKEDNRTHDDIALRTYYAEWGRLMGRDASRPMAA